MLTFIAKRLLSAIPVLLGISILVFGMAHLAPGDPAAIMLGLDATAESIERLREELGLNDPLPVQYWRFLSGALRGDLGRSMRTNRKVVTEIADRFPNTIKLAAAAMALAVVVGVTAGVISASHHGSVVDSGVMVGAILGVSMPAFWLGLMLMYFFSLQLRWLPVQGMGTWKHMVLPAIVLGSGSAAVLARMTRSGMLEVLRQDYVRTARAKGLAQRVVLYRHALKNALIPVVTIIGLQLGGALGGAVIVESLFAWPGVGRLAITALMSRDFPMMQGIVLYLASGYLLANLVVDLVYGYLDPRIRVAGEPDR
ncbi:MAG: nickel ABC transporter permease [Bacillota bacterium]